MKRLPIDADTADRLLAGSVAPEDAPPGYAPVAVVLSAAAGERVGDELRREEETLAVVAEIVRASLAERPRLPRRSFVPRLRLATALVTVALAGTTGLALAGGLPGGAQDVASTMLAKVGVSVDGPNSHAGDHPNVRGKSSESESTAAEDDSTSSEGASTSSASGKGAEISALATSTDLRGVAKGAAISTLASGGKSQAGQHGKAGEEHGSPAATPNGGGAGTAGPASNGHGADGSANAAAGQSHRP
jgi:hypothetical protein